MYLEGMGVQKDYIAALMWFLIAEQYYQHDALIALLEQRTMLDENNENFFKNKAMSILDPLQIKEAEKLASDFLKTH